MSKLRSIQVLRGLAACGVVFLHARLVPGLGSTGSRILVGAAGVDLFFVISGFIMASIPKRPSFLFDRFWRIYPLWWVAVIPWILFCHPHWQTLAASLTLWPLFGEMVIPILPVGWTLSFEMLFYFAVAASARIGAKPLLAIFGLMLLGAALTHSPIFDFFGNPIIFEFLLGALIAKLPKDKRLAVPLLIVALLQFARAPTWVYTTELALRAPASAWRVLYWGVPAALIVYACLSAEKLFQHRYWNFPVLLGNASYSIYLFHLGMMKVVHLEWISEVTLSIGGGVAAWWFIERQILALKPGHTRVAALVP